MKDERITVLCVWNVSFSYCYYKDILDFLSDENQGLSHSYSNYIYTSQSKAKLKPIFSGKNLVNFFWMMTNAYSLCS